MIDTLLLFTQFLLIIAISFVISFYPHIYKHLFLFEIRTKL